MNRRSRFCFVLGWLACESFAICGQAAEIAAKPIQPPVKPLPYPVEQILSPLVRDTYEGVYLDQVRFPLGGIGSGCISLSGRGALVDWSIFGNPNLGWRPELSFLGLWAKAGSDEAVFRVLEGEKPPPFGWGNEGQGSGPLAVAGLPHMRTAVFKGRFPFAQVTLSDPGMPLEATIEGWSPFIPGNDRESSLPVACLTIRLKNVTDKVVNGTLGYNLKNLAHEGKDEGTCSELLRCAGYDLLLMRREGSSGKDGSLAVATPCRITTWQRRWAPSNLAPSGGFQHFAETFCIHGRYDSSTTVEASARVKARPSRPDIVIDDFESGTYGKWSIEGEAFGNAPCAIEQQQHPVKVADYQGTYLANSLLGGKNDAPIGKLVSKPFTVERANLSFLIAGGEHPAATCVNLLVDNRVVRTATGNNSERLISASWKVDEFAGRTARLEIVDAHRGEWGHILVDNIIMTDADQEETWPGGIGSMGWQFTLEPGAGTTIPLVLAWYFPSRKDVPGVQNYYSTQWSDAAAAANYVLANRVRLERETRRFQETFFDSSLPGAILESVSSQLAILRSPTVFREANGTLHGWEGSWPNGGSCEGTVTHVWHYVQSIAYLFPALERGMREFDFTQRVDPKTGGLRMRVWPARIGDANVAVDGHFGTILRACREWQVCGDTQWLRTLWPEIRKSVEFAWTRWDKDRDGRLDADASWHCTLDQDLRGDETYGNSMYMAGMLAGERMARAVGDEATAIQCRRVFDAGRKATDRLCWNGEYYRQVYPGADTRSTWLNGVISEQLIGQWWADMLGLGEIYPRQHMRSAVESVFKHNFVPDCRKVLNTGYTLAMNDDAGLVICSWPNGGRPDQALFYADTIEVGYEDQAAANLIYHGHVLEGIAVMKAIRDRYDGRKRDPYCQIECGGYYARSLANYSVLLALSGYRVNAPMSRMEFAPKIMPEDFKSFFAAAEGWGSYSQKITGEGLSARLEVKWGKLRLKEIAIGPLSAGAKAAIVISDGRQLPHRLALQDRNAVVILADETVVLAGSALEIKMQP